MNSFLQRYNVGRRLGGAFGLLILLSCLLVAAGLLSMSRAREELDNIVKVNVEKARIGNGMLDANTNILVALGTLSMITSEELNQQALAEIKTQRQRYADLRKQLEAFPASEKGKALRAGNTGFAGSERVACVQGRLRHGAALHTPLRAHGASGDRFALAVTVIAGIGVDDAADGAVLIG
jgi:hypothetical protein